MAYSTIKDPSAHFHTQIWTGNSGFTVNVTNNANSGDFQPDLIWAKDRPNAYNHDLVDSSRGPTVALHPNTNAAEYTRTQSNYDFTSFDSNGFTTGAPDFTNSFGGNNNANGKVAWQWKANGGTTSTNTDGDINSTVQVNADAGFSIVLYNPSNTTTRNIGHGLGVKPDCILIRNRTRVENWRMWFNVIGQGALTLDGTAAYTVNSSLVNSATTSTFNVGGDFSVNGNYPYVAYCFAQKQGYSRFGKYIGTGARAYAPFIYTGFKPAFVMVRCSNITGQWLMFDSARNPYNGDFDYLLANSNGTEQNSGLSFVDPIDFLSNGFRVINYDAWMNGGNNTYVYMAFAESPFVAGGIPTTAR